MAAAAVARLERSGHEDAFRAAVERHRGALRAHCYGMLRSLDDADDAVQETLLRAWRGLPGFHGQSSLRRWLLRIATNVCIDIIQRNGRRPPTLEYDATSEPPLGPPGEAETALAPDAQVERREAVALAFSASRRLLPPRQRAALVLRDVLGYSAKETAATLDTTVASITSALQRARAAADGRPLRHNSQRDDLGRRFAAAIERGDTDTIVRLLTEEPRDGERA